MNDALEQMARAAEDTRLTTHVPHRELRHRLRAAIAAIPEDSDALVHDVCNAGHRGSVYNTCNRCKNDRFCYETARMQIAALKAALKG